MDQKSQDKPDPTMNASNSKKAMFNVPINIHQFGQQFHESFPPMSQPKCVGYFSINGDREFQDNADNVSYLHLPTEMPLDLNAGIDNVLRKKEVSKYHDIEMLCRYIYNHQGELLQPFSGGKKGARRLQADFVTLRGLLRLIMCLPYGNNELRLHAVRMNNNIYMMKLETEQQRKEVEESTAYQKSMCSWGFKFEQYVTTSNPKEKPKTDVPVNEAEEFVAMFQCQFAGMRLLFGAEMDCIRTPTVVDLSDPKALRSAEFVELKTCQHNMSFRQNRSFELFKSANWWSQSFLVGISKIYSGMRDSKGLVHEIKEYKVRDLPRNKPWSPNAMGVYLQEFLTQIKHLMENIHDPFAVVQIDYTSATRCATYEIIKNDEAKQILPDWYRLLLSEMPTKKMKLK